MTETLGVVALDAADYALLQRWDCENLLLDSHAELETITGTRGFPLTTEVWPTVATGVPPAEHGLVADGEQQAWENPVLETASHASAVLLPDRMRVLAGELLSRFTAGSGTGMTLQTTDATHPFAEGGVYGWPGLTDATHLLEAWRWLELVKDGAMDPDDLVPRLFENTGQELDWLTGLADRGFPALGVHMHVLDAAGHVYADSEPELREIYHRVDDLFGALTQVFDDLLVLSDHGMQVSWLDDESVGDHSMRAYAATTVDAELPESVYDVRDWIEHHRGPETRGRSGGGEMATTKEQLRDLGYLN